MRPFLYISRACTVFVSLVFINGMYPTALLVAAQEEGTTKIVFVSQDRDTDAMTLNIANADGTNVVPLVNDGNFFNPVLSPDGRYIVFDGEQLTSRKSNLYVMNTDGTNLRTLVKGQTTYKPTGPIAWSQDSSSVIFGFLDYNRQPSGFYRINIDGSGLERLEFDNLPITSRLTKFADTWVAWSPDGSQIAIKVRTNEDDGSNNGAFYFANPDGSNALPFLEITDPGSSSDRLIWSPDVTQILLYSFLTGLFDEEIYLANADGSNIKTLINLSDYPSSPSWCSDNSQIVFVANEQGVESMPGGDLWVINLDGSDMRSLNIEANVAGIGTSCGVVPSDVILPNTPISFANTTQ